MFKRKQNVLLVSSCYKFKGHLPCLIYDEIFVLCQHYVTKSNQRLIGDVVTSRLAWQLAGRSDRLYLSGRRSRQLWRAPTALTVLVHKERPKTATLIGREMDNSKRTVVVTGLSSFFLLALSFSSGGLSSRVKWRKSCRDDSC